MNKNKIKHPYQVPDNFFDDFKKETIEKLENLPQGRRRAMKFALQFTKYAAIIVFSFFLGRASINIINGENEKATQFETYTVDDVMLQICDEDITNFILEDATIEL